MVTVLLLVAPPALVSKGSVVTSLGVRPDIKETAPAESAIKSSSALQALTKNTPTPALSISSFTASPNPVTINSATTLSVSVSGGTSPYSFTYTGLPYGCVTSDASSLSCTPTSTGAFTVNVYVTDSSSPQQSATSSLSLVVNSTGSSQLVVNSFTASVNPLSVNTATILSVSVTGGTTPYSYAYSGLPLGCASSDTASLSCTPTTTGAYTVTVTVSDSSSPAQTTTASLSLTVNGATTYNVAFSETGLPAGTSWSTTLNGQTLSSTTATNTFTEINGTYHYTVDTITGYAASPSTGNLTVKGAPITVFVLFAKVSTYSVIFTERGLPSATSWSVTVNGSTVAGKGNLVFIEPNGTYPFSVGAVPGYTISPGSGNVTVNGAAVNASITFALVQYSVVFTEVGLPSGIGWSVSMNGTTDSSTATVITFQEANGNYTFKLGSVSGYTGAPSSGSVKVNGAATSESITFTSSSSPGNTNQTTGFLGLPGYDGYFLLIVIATVAVAVVVFALTRKKKAGAAPPPPPRQ